MNLHQFRTIEQVAAAVRTIISKNFFGVTRTTANGFFSLGTPTELTISGGEITVTKSYHSVATEESASTDDLDTINGGSHGDILVLYPADDADDVVMKDTTGNLRLAGDFTMDSIRDTITLMFIINAWVELSRSNNQ